MKSSTPTYGQLEHLLAELGYRLIPSSEAGARLWSNLEFDAIKYLPAAPQEEPARPHHLAAIRKISIEKGIVEEGEFNRLLEKAVDHHAAQMASHNIA